MSQLQNTRVLLSRRPHGEPQDDDFSVDSVAVPELEDGEVLIKTLWLSLDPYMRGRMNDEKSYAPPARLDEVMVGESAGVIVDSRSEHFAAGDYVCSQSGWQSYYVTKAHPYQPFAGNPYRVDTKAAPLSAYLGVLGMPGRTGYFGLLRVGKPQPGETVVVSAASGAVGSVVGQVAKQNGCRAVGVAGGPKKCGYVVEELGFDECVDYKGGKLQADLAAACPDGIDVYFENVGGEVLRAVMPLLNEGARVPICGFISAYNTEDRKSVRTPFHELGAMEHPPEHRFFLGYEWVNEYAEGMAQMTKWIRGGKLKYRESIVEGIENAPSAFRGLLQGKNFGKQLIKVADDSEEL